MEGELRIMTKEQVYLLAEKAYQNNELDKLFLGKEPYQFDNLKHIPANVATDISALINEGIYELYNDGQQEIPQVLKRTICELLKGSPIEIWTAYKIIWNQNWDNRHGKAPFYIIDSELSQFAKAAILSNKCALSSCKELVGWNLENGLWQDIARLERNLNNKYGAGLL